MKHLIQVLLIFTLLTAVGLATVVFKDKWDYTMADPQIPKSPQGLTTEISMNVYNDWCDSPKCPDYEITFRREGRETYYSSAMRTATRSGETRRGDLSSFEFEQLAELLEAQGFFRLQRVYPENSGCADCVIVRVSAGSRRTPQNRDPSLWRDSFGALDYSKGHRRDGRGCPVVRQVACEVAIPQNENSTGVD